MIDRNKLNRIKGVLSARAGAEIPKFTPGGSVTTYNHNDPDFVSFINLTKARHNPITWDRYQKLKSLNPSASIEQLAADYHAGKDVQTNTDIPGAPDITTTTAVEEAKKQNEQVEIQKQNIITGDKAAEEVFDPAAPMSPNDPPKLADLATVKAVIPEKLEVPQQILDQQKSAGMNFIKDKEKQENSDKRNESINKIIGKAAPVVTEAFQGIGDAFGAAQAATDSTTTKTADAIYDQTAEVVKKLGPVGQVVGTAMGFAGTAGDIIQGLGGGTDQMTGTDKWMDSSFFSWNIGMLNGFGGKKTDAFAADQDILASVGSSYGGTTEDINTAASKASKKYGLFSSGARRKANRQIADARAKQNLMGDISDEATDQRLAVQSMGEQAGLAYSLMTDGGYSQKYTYAAKHGGLLEWNPEIELEWEPQIELNWELPEFKEGGSIDLVEELEWSPEFQNGGKTRTLEELIEYAKKENPRFIQRLSESPKGINFVDEEGKNAQGSHLLGYELDEEGNAIVFPSIQEMEDGNLKYLSLWDAFDRAIEKKNFLKMTPEEAKLFTESGEDENGNLFGYKKGWPKFFQKFKNGGKTEGSDIPEIEETTQKNVIPEGALHKNKHHMEHAEGLTKKGIPVIDEDGEQQAEIEHSEIIFTLEVTKKLEEYYDIFYSEESSNKEKEQAALDAGKLLVYQILENTEDRTGLIESCKKGGSLNLKKSTDDLIEEVLEWMPTIVVIEEEEIKEEKPKEDKKKSEKEQMKEAIKEVLIELLTK